MTPETLFTADPITTFWLGIIALLLCITVAVPIIRAVTAAMLLLVAALTGRSALRHTAARVMPRIGHLIGSVVLGTAAVAAPAFAAGHSAPGTIDAIDLDRDAGASRVQPRPGETVTTPPERSQSRASDVATPRAPVAETAPQKSAAAVGAASGMYTVRTGDSLWEIAARELPHADDREITEAWRAIWRANRDVIGANPGLIRPGQQIDISGATA